MTNINLNNLIQEAKMWNTEIKKLTLNLSTITDEYMIECYRKVIIEMTEILTPLKTKLSYYHIFYTSGYNNVLQSEIVHELDFDSNDIDGYIESKNWAESNVVIVGCRTANTIEELENAPAFRL